MKFTTASILILVCLAVRAPAQAPLETQLAKFAVPVFDLSFPGGTATELIAAIRKGTELKVNVVIPPELADS